MMSKGASFRKTPFRAYESTTIFSSEAPMSLFRLHILYEEPILRLSYLTWGEPRG